MHETWFRPLPDDDLFDLDPEVSSEGEVMERVPPPSQKPIVVKPGVAAMKFTSPWNDVTRAIVAKYWGKISAAKIAEMIPGVTGRNAVISVAHRMGLPKPGRMQPPLPANPSPAAARVIAAAYWTPDDIELLRTLCAAGKRYDEIAEVMERTQNAIKHACRRHGIVLPPVTGIAAARRLERAQIKAAAPAPETHAEAEIAAEPDARPAPGGFRVVTIIELEQGMCRWPIDTDIGVCYCGRGPIAAQPSGAQSPYCAKHVAIAYTPTRRQQSERTQVYLSKIA